jgi:hypothetical protein
MVEAMMQTTLELLDTTNCSTISSPICTSGLFNVNGQILVLVCPLKLFLCLLVPVPAASGDRAAVTEGLTIFGLYSPYEVLECSRVASDYMFVWR